MDGDGESALRSAGNTIGRRDFLHAGAFTSFALASSLAGSLDAFAPQYDVVIHGGRVIDPGQRVDRIADVAIRDGRIAAIRPKIGAAAAKESIDATGKLVMPGLIDIHTHLGEKMMPPGLLMADGVTAMVDAGSRGCDNADDLLETAKSAPNHIRILLNIGHLGVVSSGELLDINNAKPDQTRKVIEQNREWIVGIKARLSRTVAGDKDLEAVRLARLAADPLKVPIMVHIGQTAHPLLDILAALRPGDIVTHMYAPPPNGILDANGKVLAQVREARERGLRFDFGNGRSGHFTWDVLEKGIQQDFLPDTLSTDMTSIGRTDQVFNLPSVMSKFLMMGVPIDKVIAMVTSNSAKSIPEFKDYGSLRTGAAADVAVLELTDGEFDFVDNYEGKRVGHKKLVPSAVLIGGVRWKG